MFVQFLFTRDVKYKMDGIEKLVRRAQDGDKNAFVSLIEAQKLSMSRAAMAILHNEEDAADAVAETVLTVFTRLCTLREAKYFKTWMTRILICNCYDILRERRRSVPMDVLPEDAFGEDSSRGRDKVIDIQASLASLAENDRLVLTLFYLDDLSIREIAKMLGVKENTVKTRLLRGRKRFARAYAEKEENCCEACGK